MLQPANVATPATAVAGLVVQASVAPAGVVIATRTSLVSRSAERRVGKWTVMTGCVANSGVLAAPLGWVVNASFAAGAGVIVKDVLRAVVSAPSVAVRV